MANDVVALSPLQTESETDLSLLPKPLLDKLLTSSKSETLKESLETLIEASRTDEGRRSLCLPVTTTDDDDGGNNINILSPLLHLTTSLSPQLPRHRFYLSLALRLLRNLCAGERLNQDAFLVLGGVDAVSSLILRYLGPDCGGANGDVLIARFGLQVLANVCLAGVEHQRKVWRRLFHDVFLMIARVRRREVVDPLCMVLYVCCDGIRDSVVNELCGESGLVVLCEIVVTASMVGFEQEWFKRLLFRFCLENACFPHLFASLYSVVEVERSGCPGLSYDMFSEGQAYLLRLASEVLNEQLHDVIVPVEFAMAVFRVFMRSIGINNLYQRGEYALPTGSTKIDILGYSLAILRDVCAKESRAGLLEDSVDAVNMLLADGLLELLLELLRDLEPPDIIRKATKNENPESDTSRCSTVSPYKGFRRDLVAVIGNCAYGRKHVQDKVRNKDGILLLLQQCVTDGDDPFLREWGIWCMRNLLEGNAENLQAVFELELQGTVDMPELAALGLKVEFDPQTKRAKLVNIPKDARK